MQITEQRDNEVTFCPGVGLGSECPGKKAVIRKFSKLFSS